MRCEDVLDRLPDLLDGLLEDGEAARLDAHRDSCAACAARTLEIERTRVLLHARPEVGPPPPRLRARILSAASAPRRLWILSLVRYAAVFLAGVGATLAFTSGPQEVRVPDRPVAAESPAPSELPVIEVASPRVPRRIR